MVDWWHQIELFSQRDQLGLNYVLWKHGIPCLSIESERGPNPGCGTMVIPIAAPISIERIRPMSWHGCARRLPMPGMRGSSSRDLRQQTNRLRNPTDRDRRFSATFPYEAAVGGADAPASWPPYRKSRRSIHIYGARPALACMSKSSLLPHSAEDNHAVVQLQRPQPRTGRRLEGSALRVPRPCSMASLGL